MRNGQPIYMVVLLLYLLENTQRSMVIPLNVAFLLQARSMIVLEKKFIYELQKQKQKRAKMLSWIFYFCWLNFNEIKSMQDHHTVLVRLKYFQTKD